MTSRTVIVGLLALSSFALHVHANEIYKSVDEQGRVIYSDRPIGNSGERVELPTLNTLPRDANQPAPQAAPRQQQQEATVDYQLTIDSPQDDAAVPPGQRDLAIAVNLDRPLHPDHLLLFMMNGEVLEETRNNSIMVREITRGAHSLHVEVIDVQGNPISRSESVTVNVHRPSVLIPPRN